MDCMVHTTILHCQRLEFDAEYTVVGEVDSMGLKGAIERLLRRRNADTGQRIEAK